MVQTVKYIFKKALLYGSELHLASFCLRNMPISSLAYAPPPTAPYGKAFTQHLTNYISSFNICRSTEAEGPSVSTKGLP